MGSYHNNLSIYLSTESKDKPLKTTSVHIQTTDDIVSEITNSGLPWLKTYALKLCNNHEADSEDLYQETVLKVLSNKSKFRLGSNFKARTSTIMKNGFINGWRKKQNNPIYFTGDNTFHLEPSTLENNAPGDLEIEQLFTYISSLPDQNRVPFEMALQGFSYEEIEAELAIPLGTVKSRIFFARKELKKHIGLDRY